MFNSLRIKNMIVVSPSRYGDQIIDSLRRYSPATSYLKIAEFSVLNLIPLSFLKDSRLISFSTKIIVPDFVLENLGHGAYNFHPGPPNYPGWAPFSFAIYENAKNYGVTLHKMTRLIDSGEIVGIHQFPIKRGIVQAELENISLSESMKMIEVWAPILAKSTPLRVIPTVWSGVRKSQKDFKAMCSIDSSISRDEFHRRLKAFGNGDGKYTLYTHIQDKLFKLDLTKSQDQITEFISIHGVKFEIQKSSISNLG